MTDGTFIRFRAMEIPPGQITPRWYVETLEDDDYLGVVKWFGPWRKYGFFPAQDCVFEETCMREISQFIEEQTRSRRQK